MEDHKNCRYRFLKWLVRTALRYKSIYWLLWGMLIAVCAIGFNIKELF